MTSCIQIRTASPAETRAVGAAVAAWLEAGDVVALSGDLGAGKTCFVQGAAAALDVAERVTSPTFVLSRQYRGRLDVVHVDVYRLDRVAHVDQLGDDVFADDVVTFVEWASAVRAVLPPDRLDVTMAVVDDGRPATTDDDGVVPDDVLARTVTVTGQGRVADRLPALASRVHAAGLHVQDVAGAVRPGSA